MACFPLTRVPRYAMPNSSLHPAFAALPSAHPARGVDDELRWGPISLRVCTTCFAPSGPREVTGTLPSYTAGIASYSRALCPRRARWPASHTFGALGATAASHAHTTCSGLGSQALRQRAVVASSVLDAPSRHGCRGHPSSEGPVGELHMRTATECAPPPLERHRGAARAPPNAQVSERAKACRARRTR